jgi:hypothetical protein
MEQRVGAWIRSEVDLERNALYRSFDEFVDALDNQTDMDLHVEVDDDLLRVVHLDPRCSAAGQMTFPFPFDTQDVLNWVYHFENDHDIRFDVHGDVANMLDVPVNEDEVAHEGDAETLRSERTDQVLAFVEELLWDRWIAGSTWMAPTCS